MKKYLEVLKKCPFFNGLTDEEIISVLHCVDGRTIKKKRGEYIFRAGDSISSMGLVLSGSLLIFQEDLWGRRNIMAKICEGDFFGESFAATRGSVLNISAQAKEDCEILLLNIGRLLSVCPAPCAHHDRLIRNFISVLAGKVLLLNEKISNMSKRTTKEKLLSYLSSEAIRQGKTTFEIPYDRQQLADYLGVERAAMSAELSKLKREGLLETKKSKFVLHAVKEI